MRYNYKRPTSHTEHKTDISKHRYFLLTENHLFRSKNQADVNFPTDFYDSLE